MIFIKRQAWKRDYVKYLQFPLYIRKLNKTSVKPYKPLLCGKSVTVACVPYKKENGGRIA